MSTKVKEQQASNPSSNSMNILRHIRLDHSFKWEEKHFDFKEHFSMILDKDLYIIILLALVEGWLTTMQTLNYDVN